MEHAEPSMGLTLKLSPEVAARLRDEGSNKSNSTSNDNGNSSNDGKKNGARTDRDVDSDLPVISVDLERLIGYQPQLDELDSIRSQLVAAMWTRYNESSSDRTITAKSDENEDDVSTLPPPDFDLQIRELLESGAAIFGPREEESSSLKASSGVIMVVKYPPKLQSPSTGEHVSTSDLWREIIRHPTELPPFVERLWKFLKSCSHNLFWKRDMSVELKELIREEQARLEYKEWTETKRKQKLENLYSIRETMMHQVELAKEKLDAFQEEREIKVQDAMQQYHRRNNNKAGGGKSGLESFGTTELSFPDEFQLLGLRDEAYDDEDDWGLDESSDYSSGGYSSEDSSIADDSDNDDGYECDHDELEKDNTPLTLANKLPDSSVMTYDDNKADGDKDADTSSAQLQSLPSTTPADEIESSKNEVSTPFLRRRERREKARRKKRQQRKEEERKQEAKRLKEMEEQIRTRFTTNDLILAQTLWEALDTKLQNVDTLLESLQDEVWEAEEIIEEEEVNPRNSMEEPNFSLLDQVLAMILGATPIQPGMSPQDHYNFVRNEHKSIVEQWKEHFGRLPPPAGGTVEKDRVPPPKKETATPVQQRLALGITDNDAEDWDAVEDWEDYLKEERKGTASANTGEVDIAAGKKKYIPDVEKKPKAVGLRPGGSTKR